MFTRLTLPFSTPTLGSSQQKERILLRFLAYMTVLLGKTDRGSDAENGLQELREAVFTVMRSEGGMQNANRRLTAVENDTFQDIENMDFNQLRSLLEEIAVKSSTNRNALEKELRADRFVTAYCTLKDLAAKSDAIKKQHSKHRVMDTTRTSAVSISGRQQQVLSRGASQQGLSGRQ
eukprot:gene158-191_t